MKVNICEICGEIKNQYVESLAVNKMNKGLLSFVVADEYTVCTDCAHRLQESLNTLTEIIRVETKGGVLAGLTKKES